MFKTNDICINHINFNINANKKQQHGIVIYLMFTINSKNKICMIYGNLL